MVRVHVWVTGLVQGVFYRYTTKETAKALGLTGWVRNLSDGRVEFVAEGDKETVDKLINWSHEGPTHARVEHVQTEWEEYTGEYSKFSVTD
jgi:acylphosphatase